MEMLGSKSHADPLPDGKTPLARGCDREDIATMGFAVQDRFRTQLLDEGQLQRNRAFARLRDGRGMRANTEDDPGIRRQVEMREPLPPAVDVDAHAVRC